MLMSFERVRNLGLATTIMASALVGIACEKGSRTMAEPTRTHDGVAESVKRLPSGAYDLELGIDPRGWERVVSSEPMWGVVPFVSGPEVECPPLITKICMGITDPKFEVRVNGLMMAFMFQQAGLEPPLYQTRIFFTDQWLPRVDGRDLSGMHVVYRDEAGNTRQEIVVSLSTASLEVVKGMRDKNEPLELDRFNGGLSIVVSEDLAHEAAHGGKEVKVVELAKGSVFDKILRQLLHPQVEAFTDKYRKMLIGARNPVTALIAGVLFRGPNLQEYLAGLIKESERLGIEVE